MNSIADRLQADRITWASDIHLDWIRPEDIEDRVAKPALRALEGAREGWTHIVTGDLAEGHMLGKTAEFLAAHAIYFILGNHDRWGLTLEEADKRAREHGGNYYLHDRVLQGDNGQWALVGHNGFFDLRSGIVCPNVFETWDATYIWDLKDKSYHQLAYQIPEMVERDTQALIGLLDNVDAPRIYIATHVPPFEEACLYRGKISDDTALPFFCNTTLGDYLLEYVNKRPNVDFVVLAGHTHHDYEGKHASNLMVGVRAKTPIWNTNFQV